MSKEEEADARSIKLVRYTNPNPQSWKGRESLEKSRSLPVQQKRKNEGRLMDMLKSRSARFHNLTVNRSSSAGSRDSSAGIKKNQETCFLPIRTPESVSRPTSIFSSPVQKLNLDTNLIPSSETTNHMSFTSKVKKMLEERRPQLSSAMRNEQSKSYTSSEDVRAISEATSKTIQGKIERSVQRWGDQNRATESMSSESEIYDKEDPLPRGRSAERIKKFQEDDLLRRSSSQQQDMNRIATERDSIRSRLFSLFAQVETENRECGSASNFRLVQLLYHGENEKKQEADKEEDDKARGPLQGSVVAFEGELGPPEDSGTSRLEVVYLSDEEEERKPRPRVLSPCSGLLRRPVSPTRSMPLMTDPTAEKRKNDREVAIDALNRLQDKTTFDKESFIQIVEKGVANYKAIAGNPMVSVTNDVCSVNNYETSHAYYYQQFDRRSKLAWISLHEPTTGNGSEPLKDIWKSELLASLMSCTIFFYRTPSSNLSPEQQEASDHQINQLKKLLRNKFCVRIISSLDRKVDIVILHGQNEKILSDFFERKGNTSFHVWSLQRILNYLEDIGINLQEWDIKRDAQDRELIVDIPLSEDSVEEDANDSTEEEQQEVEGKEQQEKEQRDKERQEKGPQKKEQRDKEWQEKEQRERGQQEKERQEAERKEAERREKALQEKALQEKALQEKALQEKALQEKALQEKALQEKALQEKALQEKALQEKALQEKALQEKALQEKALQEKALQEKALQEKALQEKALQEKALQEKALQEKALQEKALQEKALHEKALQEKALHEKALQEKALQEKAQQRKNRPNNEQIQEEEFERNGQNYLRSENDMSNLAAKRLARKASRRVEEKYVNKLLHQASDALDKRDFQLKTAHNIILALSKDVMRQEVQITSLGGQLADCKKQLAHQSDLSEQYRVGMAEQEIEMAQLRSQLTKKKSKKSYRVHKNPRRN